MGSGWSFQFAIALNGAYSRHLIQLVISLELILLSIALLSLTMTFYFDDLLGATLAIYLLPLAGAESAVALALLVAFYPQRLNLLYDDLTGAFAISLFYT